MLIFLVMNLLIALGFGGWNLYLAIRRPMGMSHYLPEQVRSFNKMVILVPAMNEEETIADTVTRLLQVAQAVRDTFDLRIVVIDDASSDGTVAALSALGHHAHLTLLKRQLPKAQTGKGDALNAALDWLGQHHMASDKSIIGVIDSDSTPDTAFFTKVHWAFNHSHYDLVQTGVSINNAHTFLGLMQEFEFNVANKLVQVMRMDWGSALASGNGQFMTLKMARSIRWSDALLDDLEFSLKGLLKGYYGGFLPYNPVPQQATSVYRALLHQRTRWCQGGMQCLFKYGRQIAESPRITGRLKVDIWAFMLLPFIGLFILPTSVSAILTYGWLMVGNFGFQTAIMVVIVVANLGVNLQLLHAARMTAVYRQRGQLIKMLAGNLIYIWLLAPVPYMALYRLVTGQNGWVKTTHVQLSGGES